MTPKYAVVIDTETDGIDREQCQLLQVAIVIVELASGTRVAAREEICRADTNAAESVNRLPAAVLQEASFGAFEVVSNMVWRIAEDLRPDGDDDVVLVAHNADFDRTVLERYGWPKRWVWVCSAMDVRWPGRDRAGKLVELALHYGCGVARAHGALDDVMTLAFVLERVRELGHDLQALMVDAQAPKKLYAALVSYDRRDEARAAGFYWEPGPKQWRRRMRVDDIASLPFPVREVSP